MVQNTLALSNGEQGAVNTLAVPVQALANTAQISDAIEKGVNTFMEAVPALMKALDEVAKIHPFISGIPELTRICVLPLIVYQLPSSHSRRISKTSHLLPDRLGESQFNFGISARELEWKKLGNARVALPEVRGFADERSGP